MVDAAAHAHRIFLRQPQAGQCFASVHDLRPCALHRLDVGSGLRRDGTEQLQKIERGTFSRQQRMRPALHFQHHLIGRAALAIAHMPGQASLRVQLQDGGLHPGTPAKHRAFACQHLRPCDAPRVNQAGSQVAATDVFLERPRGIDSGEIK